ncbi:hypothetical protein ASD08_44280 [Streptomyces sp. Root369]|nr:hypothetical protein ASD08_44280 [Streptomyces sp. Root369]
MAYTECARTAPAVVSMSGTRSHRPPCGRCDLVGPVGVVDRRRRDQNAVGGLDVHRSVDATSMPMTTGERCADGELGWGAGSHRLMGVRCAPSEEGGAEVA